VTGRIGVHVAAARVERVECRPSGLRTADLKVCTTDGFD
jgi:hypothetical protein